ncbi:hypothetical protein HSRCO_0749 [Halanaeroarchaeum sp. HSR-CO]|uniref:hypothetical protein n=1 Tax=Halanaeroarchaeum sp. HSR-CO TaxID=2866382 RepID=UPI00217D5C1F|nr:hypothetical protein [Halanaeroarchaeum sp. HSR-CO]UWG47043.1 hypothetical protein HSRCO_0749 [Halanaeroarchaeum sp. HSR-CO]
MRTGTFIKAILAAVVVTSLLAVPVAAQDTAEEPEASNTTDGDYTLEELRRGGTTAPNSPDSVRTLDGRMYWAIHWPADKMLANPGDPNDDDWTFLSSGETVQRNSVYLRTILLDEAAEDVTVKVAYYREGTRQVERANSTVTESYVDDLVVDSHDLTFQTGWAMQEIDLRRSDEPRKVTMWVEGHEDTLRWTFEHESVATSQTAGINTKGDYLLQASLDFVLPVVIGVFLLGGLVAWALRRAGKGPGWGYLKWAFVLTISSALILGTQFSDTTDLLVNAPRILAVLVVAIVAIVMLETYTTNVSHTAFFRPVLGAATSPSGEDAVDIIDLEEREEKTVQMPDGSTAVVRDGLIPFLSRIFGGAARLERSEELKTKLEVTDSPIDEMIWVHPDADEILDYEPEGWTLSIPTAETRSDWIGLAIGGATILAFTQLVSGAYGGGVGFLAFLFAMGVAVVRPRDGHARVEPAPAHLRSAWAGMLYLNIEAEDADTIEDARDTIVSLQARSEKDVQEALQEQDSTLIEEMFSEDVDRSGESLVEPIDDDQEDDRDE